MEIADARTDFERFINRPQVGIEGQISSWYGNLENVPGHGKPYLLRSLSNARPGDSVRLDPRYMDVFGEWLDHYHATGTQTVRPEDIVWSATYGAAVTGRFSTRPAEFFLFDDDAHAIRPDKVRYDVTRTYEDKALHALLWQDQPQLMPLSAVVINSEYSRQRHPAHENPWPSRVWAQIGYQPGFIKAGLTASGNDNEEFETFEELERLMYQPRWSQIDFVVQARYGNVNGSLNYHNFDEGPAYLFGTYQRNAGKCQEANFQTSDLDDSCRPLTDQVAWRAFKMGHRGPLGLDVRLQMAGSEVHGAKIIECNIRDTAPRYGWNLAMQHEAPWFGVSNLKGVRFNRIQKVLSGELLFHPNRGMGCIMHNPGPLYSHGSCSITILAPDRATGEEILRSVEAYAVERDSVAA